MPETRLKKTRESYEPLWLINMQREYQALLDQGKHEAAQEIFRAVVNRCAQAMRYLDEMNAKLPGEGDPRWIRSHNEYMEDARNAS